MGLRLKAKVLTVPQAWKVLAVFTGFYEHLCEATFKMRNSGRPGASKLPQQKGTIKTTMGLSR
jgi:hypothetical protein